MGASRTEIILAGIASGIAFVAYLANLLPGVGFWDTGVFQAAAPTLGLTHPTGYPSYMMLGWLVSNLVPIGDAAFRMNLLGAVSGALAVGALYLLIRWMGVTQVVAAIGALSFGLLQPFWRTAVRADPHPLHVLLVLAILLLILEWRRRGRRYRTLVAIATFYGVSLGNHLLMAMIGPPLALFVILSEPRIMLDVRRLGGLLAGFLVGAAVYLYVPIRAAANPPIHHDFAPTTWALFWRYVLGQDFGGSMGFLSLDGPAHAIDRMPNFLDSIVRSSSPPIAIGLLLLAGIGFVGLMRTDWRTGLLLLTAGGLTLYAALTYANGDIERYYFVPVAVLVVLAALGCQLLLRASVPALPRLEAAAPVLAIVPIVLLSSNAPRIQPVSAACYVDALFGEVSKNAIVMSWWSYATPLWYEQAVVGGRPDVEVFLGTDTIPDELSQRFGGGRPIYLIQPDSIISQLRNAYSLTPISACGVEVFEVASGNPTASSGREAASRRAGASPSARR